MEKKATDVENPGTSDYDNVEEERTEGPVLFYNDLVIEHFTNPCNVGEMSPQEADGFALVGDPACGDQMKLWIKVESGRISDIRFKSFGCPGAIATSSMATRLALGRTLEEAAELTDDDVIRELGGIPEEKKHCSLLGITAIQQAINDYNLRMMMESADSDDLS